MAMDVERQWFIIGRWQEYEGEGRANLLRTIALGAFYLVELYSYYVTGSIGEDLHRAITALAVVWSLLALAVLLCLRRQIFSATLKFISTSCDIILLTALAILDNGPASSLVHVYCFIIPLAALRFNSKLIGCATVGCMMGYVVLLGAGHPDWFGSEEFPQVVPRIEQMIVLLSLALTGIVMEQIIRRVRDLADEFVRRVDATKISS